MSFGRFGTCIRAEKSRNGKAIASLLVKIRMLSRDDLATGINQTLVTGITGQFETAREISVTIASNELRLRQVL